MRLLFIGNSATYVHNVPQILSELAQKAGTSLTAEQVTRGGFTLAQHADASTEHGQRVLREIAKGYDIVFLQENGNCILNKEREAACRAACARLVDAVCKSGAKPVFYVRPPYQKNINGLSPLEQCRQFDCLFQMLAAELGGIAGVPVNRAFGYAVQHTQIPLWGEDRAHVSPQGAHLIAYTFFAWLLEISATHADAGALSHDQALALQNAADQAVFGEKNSCL